MRAKTIKINPYFPEPALIKDAAQALREGKLVAFPTETVYGIAANFSDPEAIERLRKIKNRPGDKPFTFHIADFEALDDLNIDLSYKAERIVNKFWPGPLTVIVFDKKKNKIGVRMPRNMIALELIRDAGVPVVAPSANISGKKSPVSADEVIVNMSGLIDIILDGGTTELGMDSSILDVTCEPFKLLRKGAIQEDDLMAECHILFVCTGNSCRSVMAKALFEKFIKQSGLSGKIKVDSAGMSGYAGIPAASNTIEVMKQEGIDVSGHASKPVTEELLRKSDLVLVMENEHKKAILSRFRNAASKKIRLLKESEDIPDPIGKPLEEYRHTLGIIKDSVENVFLELREKHKEQ